MAATTEQIAVCARFNSLVVPAEANLKVGIALATLNLLPLHASRHKPINETCGCYIYGGDYSDDAHFYQPLHVAHLAGYLPQLILYLELAPGWRLIPAPGYEDV